MCEVVEEFAKEYSTGKDTRNCKKYAPKQIQGSNDI